MNKIERAGPVLVIGGSDPTGGAGIQADTKALLHAGVHGCTVVTCATTQTTREFKHLRPLEKEDVLDQLDALMDDVQFRYVKLGLLPSCGIIEAVGQRLKGKGLRLVV
ncbi:MAG: bifunctional hydroxymethylpyrimidine kinase/phosphomethylpyrimidine kinase, partial [Candidatus Thermoplasmatota archaeon]|nr:bifunctional hydroxymethylpyrimidine kinase/phosphomethylpyrimidine kinase [Candidatus Thermoplasmatota archaeon]